MLVFRCLPVFGVGGVLVVCLVARLLCFGLCICVLVDGFGWIFLLWICVLQILAWVCGVVFGVVGLFMGLWLLWVCGDVVGWYFGCGVVSRCGLMLD